MPDGQVLEFSNLTKRFGSVAAVAGFSARVEPGMVTGFLGPNGAGKTTTLRTLLGLIRADEGTATIGGQAYRSLRHPLQTVGAVLEASSFHPGRTAAHHLKMYAQAANLPISRVDESLASVGLSEAAGRKVGGFSLGMRQRLGLAYALLGDPGVLVLDEPTNGLDPEGIKWIRGFLRELAGQGRTVLISSHLLAEVQQTVDALLVIAHGRLVFQGSLDDLIDPSEYSTVVDAPDREALSAALQGAGLSFEVLRAGLTVRHADTTRVGAIAAGAAVALSTLHRKGPALEEVFLELVDGTRVHASACGGAKVSAGAGAGAGAGAPAAVAVIAEDEGAATASSVGAEFGDASLGAPGAATAAGAAAGYLAPTSADADTDTDATPDPRIGSDTDSDSDATPDPEIDSDIDPEEGEPEPHRPWQIYVKTESDVAADDFFGAFDTGESAEAASSPPEQPTGEASAPAADDAPAEAEPAAQASTDTEGDAR